MKVPPVANHRGRPSLRDEETVSRSVQVPYSIRTCTCVATVGHTTAGTCGIEDQRSILRPQGRGVCAIRHSPELPCVDRTTRYGA
jgi:hypothetical protein